MVDFNRAIELKPDYAYAIARRGETYRLMGRFEEKLTLAASRLTSKP